jgi:hypothetical protein
MHIFGISACTVSRLISTLLPLLTEYFLRYIPDKLDQYTCSQLSNNIIAILDSTIHPTRKPASQQHQYWNGHYKTHGILSHLLVDFTGRISSVITNVKGHSHDNNAAQYFNQFSNILGTVCWPETTACANRSFLCPTGNKFALADPGYNGVDYVVAGFKAKQVRTEAEKVFDRISRSEQVAIEHINNFIKKSSTLSKLNKFHHGIDKLVPCVFIICGWYNMRLSEGCYSAQ